MALINRLIEKAKKNPKRVAISECDSERMLKAARIVLDSGIGYPVLVNDPEVIRQTADAAGVTLDDMEIVDSTDPAAADALVARYYPQAAKAKLTAADYRKEIEDPMAYAMMLEAVGDVDCSFQGHIHTTGDVLRSALHIIGLSEGITTASMYALVETEGFDGPEGDVVAFADCALNTDPDAEKLSSIAIAAADQICLLMDWEPRVAFLSFSTDGSGRSDSVEKVRDAVARTRELRPDILADGEFQLDAAIDPEVAAKKVRRPSDVAGRANVLIFPDLDAANIGIKLCHGAEEAVSSGPFDAVLDCSALNRGVSSRFGYCELTRSGVHVYESDPPDKPVFAADSGRIKSIETVLGTGDGCLRGLRHIGFAPAGKNVLLFGHGRVGRGIEYALTQAGATVRIVDPAQGRVFTPDLLDGADLVISATGILHALEPYAALLLESGALLVNMGADDEFGPGIPPERAGNRKRPVNFMLSEPTSTRYIDPTLALHNAGILELMHGNGGPGIVAPSAPLEDAILADVRAAGVINDEIDALGL